MPLRSVLFIGEPDCFIDVNVEPIRFHYDSCYVLLYSHPSMHVYVVVISFDAGFREAQLTYARIRQSSG